MLQIQLRAKADSCFYSLSRFFSALVSLLSLGSLLVILQPVFGRAAEGAGGPLLTRVQPALVRFFIAHPPQMCPYSEVAGAMAVFCGHIPTSETQCVCE